jgi:hypothetical protein
LGKVWEIAFRKSSSGEKTMESASDSDSEAKTLSKPHLSRKRRGEQDELSELHTFVKKRVRVQEISADVQQTFNHTLTANESPVNPKQKGSKPEEDTNMEAEQPVDPESKKDAADDEKEEQSRENDDGGVNGSKQEEKKKEEEDE